MSKINDEEKHLDSFDKYVPKNDCDTPNSFPNVLIEDLTLRNKEGDQTHHRKSSFQNLHTGLDNTRVDHHRINLDHAADLNIKKLVGEKFN